ncbi:MAG: HEAT repeat domain-containing protein [Leptospiraceae bacterium]|nr:HEAT repeat domain-containing protein [Leptospiraceae bacterium]
MLFCVLAQPLWAQTPQQIDPVTRIRTALKAGGVERRQAIWYIYQEGHDELLPEAVAYLFESEDYDDHQAILNVMQAYGHRLERYLPAWFNILDQYIARKVPAHLLVQCVEIAIYFREDRLIHALRRLAIDPRREVRLAAYRGMVELGSDILIPVLLKMLNEPRPIYRMYALEGLIHYGDKRMVPFLVQSLNDDNKSVRIFAVAALSQHPGAAELSHNLATRYNRESNPEVRARIIEVIAFLRLTSMNYIVHRGIQDEVPLVRRAALEAARDLRDRTAGYPISRQLSNEPESELKLLAMDVMMAIENSGGGGGLIEVLAGDRQEAVRARAALALGVLRERAAVTALSHAVRDDESRVVRVEAAGALGELRDDRAVPALVDAVRRSDDSYEVRSAALLALARIDSATARSALESLYAGTSNAELRRQIQKLFDANESR